jgi:hypothetical protein
MTTMTTTIDFAAGNSEPVAASPSEIIRPFGPATVPATGEWALRGSQPLTLRGRGLRRRPLPAVVSEGRFVVTEPVLGSSLHLTLQVQGSNSVVQISAEVTRLVSAECWEAAGDLWTGDSWQPVTLRIGNNGVFRRRGRQPGLWLTVEAAVRMPRRHGLVGELTFFPEFAERARLFGNRVTPL